MGDRQTLRCEGLTKAFGGIRAVDRVTLQFDPGRVVAVVGPNGAGKTTLFHLITGFLRPDSGGVFLDGIPLHRKPPWEIARLGVGRLFQDVRVFEEMTVLENVLAGLWVGGRESPLSIWKGYRGFPGEEEKEEALRWLRFVGLEDRLDVWAGNLSFGQQKLVAIARLLAMDARVLLLDEPVAGVYSDLAKRILAMVRELAHKEGRTVVLIEHNVEMVRPFVDEMVFLHQGRVHRKGTPEEVLNDSEVRRLYFGETPLGDSRAETRVPRWDARGG